MKRGLKAVDDELCGFKKFTFNIVNIPDLKGSDTRVEISIDNKEYNKCCEDVEEQNKFNIVERILTSALKNVTLKKLISADKMILKEMKQNHAKFTVALSQKHSKVGNDVNKWIFLKEGEIGDSNKRISVNVDLIIQNISQFNLTKLKKKRLSNQMSKLEKWKYDTENVLNNLFYKMTNKDIESNEGKPWCKAAELYEFEKEACVFVRDNEKLKEAMRTNKAMTSKTIPERICIFKKDKTLNGEETVSIDGGIVLLARSQINRAALNDRKCHIDDVKFCTDYKDMDMKICDTEENESVWYCDDNASEFWKVKKSASLCLAYSIQKHIKMCKCQCTRCLAVKTLNPDINGWEHALELVKKWKMLDYVTIEGNTCHVSYISPLTICRCGFS